MIRNYYLLTSVAISFICIGLLLLYVLPKQLKETRRPRNEFSQDRRLLLTIEMFMCLSFVPGLPRMFQLLSTPPANNWAKVATISNRIAPLIVVLGVSYFYYRRGKRDIQDD